MSVNQTDPMIGRLIDDRYQVRSRIARGGMATVYLATAPKSNAAYNGINAAIADVKAGSFGRVPTHLRDAHYPGAKRLGHGKGYVYAHDAEHGVATQQYLPDELQGTSYYRPTENGHERDIAVRWKRLLEIIRGKD